jgi:NAD(P)H-flavin reductase/hemoglobin-like flavoprotein
VTTESSDGVFDFNARLIKASFARAVANPQEAMEYFYAHLFVRSPEMRAMFPLSMRQLRERVFAALARLIWSMDSQSCCTQLGQIARDHRKFGVTDQHYEVFFRTLVDTVQHFDTEEWLPETTAAWHRAVAMAAAAMRAAAEADAQVQPAWWIGEVLVHDLRTPSVAVLTIRPDHPLRFDAGQYLSVQVTRWPRTWRQFSIANAPRASGLIDLHVRAVSGGLVSTALVHHTAVGDAVVLGPARGDMIAADNDRDLLCVAGGTGLGPIKALIEGVIGSPGRTRQRRITLFVGARREEELYDMPALRALADFYPGLQIIPVLSEQPDYSGLTGQLADVVGGHGLFDNCEAYICGPDPMVRQTTLRLAAQIPASHIHHDPLPDAELYSLPAGSASLLERSASYLSG